MFRLFIDFEYNFRRRKADVAICKHHFVRFFLSFLFFSPLFPSPFYCNFLLFCFLWRGDWTLGVTRMLYHMMADLIGSDGTCSPLWRVFSSPCLWGPVYLHWKTPTTKKRGVGYIYMLPKRYNPTWVETFENPQRQVDLDLWFLSCSDFFFFLSDYTLPLSLCVIIHSLFSCPRNKRRRTPTKRKGKRVEKHISTHRGSREGHLWSKSCLSICVWRIVSTEGDHRRGFS